MAQGKARCLFEMKEAIAWINYNHIFSVLKSP